jgi:hypothetical protein
VVRLGILAWIAPDWVPARWTMDAAAWTISVIAIVIVMLIALREFGRR